VKAAKLVKGALVFVRFGTAGWQVAEVLALELGKLRGVQVRKWRDNSQRWTTPVWKEAGACFQLEYMSDEQKRRPENARLLRLLERADQARQLSAEIAAINATPVGTIEPGPDGRNRYVPAKREPSVLERAHAAISDARAGRGVEAVLELGETLARKLTASTSFADLLDAWPKHGYRPTVRVDMGPEYEALAELYDYAQARAGRQVVAYRGGGSAWSRREQVADPI
jgi:hypothetical protein